MTGHDVQKIELPQLRSDALASELNDELVRRYGLLLSSSDLAKVLGYPSANAYCQAIVRGTVPVPLMRIPNRRGKFALARDVAVWLSEQHRQATAVLRTVAQHGPSKEED
jgi:hypothetical protein